MAGEASACPYVLMFSNDKCFPLYIKNARAVERSEASSAVSVPHHRHAASTNRAIYQPLPFLKPLPRKPVGKSSYVFSARFSVKDQRRNGLGTRGPAAKHNLRMANGCWCAAGT
ncbi:hypothetical protein TNIN_164971 [Trichonephila inaurata madagascariensis]|uniref:Uncharacterized protein n=1 Tax=Trichonephila inaurata madagascariensis TaxID=2747483 RepID=A0A8X7CMB7_9ARAC|nr:hypothetical protein TNIN_164971 [Trichonephila inaurata madagascariensis]